MSTVDGVLVDVSWPGEAGSVGAARRAVVGVLGPPFDRAERAAQVALVVSELCANAVEASPGEPFDVLVHRDADDGALVVTVTNRSDGALPPLDSLAAPPPSALRGRGLALIDEVADGMSVDRRGGDVSVTARFEP